MKKTLIKFALTVFTVGLLQDVAMAQAPAQNIVNVSRLKTKTVEKGSMEKRDSLIAIYNDNVIKKNDFILSHREYSHFFTNDSKDYLVIDEYKSFATMEESWKMTTELEKKAWPDEKKRKEFMDSMNAYFDDWHGDNVFHTNAKLTKN